MTGGTGAGGASGSSGTSGGVGGATGGVGGTMADSYVPGPGVKVTGTPLRRLLFQDEKTICAVDAAGDFACARLGFDPLNPMLRVERAGPFVAVERTGAKRVVALRKDGTIETWLMSGTDEPLCAPGPTCKPDPPAGKFTAFAAWNDRICAIQAGAILCWGEALPATLAPPPGNDFMQIDLNHDFACALRNDGEFLCWGDLSDSTFRDIVVTEPCQQVVLTDEAWCVVTEAGAVICDGSQGAARRAAGGVYARIVVDGAETLCTLTEDGKGWCFGLDPISHFTPYAGPYVELAYSWTNACGLRGDDRLECWGRDWGNGAGKETCALWEGRLSVDGNPEQLYSSGGNAWDKNIGGG
jgi:hypothetical protein